MITIQDDLRIARDRYVSALMCGEYDVADQWRATSMRLAYNTGELPPNYPMPAIRICIWCGLDCMNCPIHELKCITHGPSGLQCNKLHLFQ